MAGGSTVLAQLQTDLKAIKDLTDYQAERAQLAAEVEAARAMRLAGCGYLLDSGLAASKLPAAMVEHVRVQFAGKVFEPSELTTAIDGAQAGVEPDRGGQRGRCGSDSWDVQQWRSTRRRRWMTCSERRGCPARQPQRTQAAWYP